LGESSPGPQIERRSLTRGESWQRTGSKIAALPVEYTGEKTMARPLGSYLHMSLTSQIPKRGEVEDHQARMKQFIQLTKDHRKEIIEAATKARAGKKHVYLKANEPAAHGVAKWRMKPDLFPEGTPPATLHRAYNHAALLAMHDRGLVDYDFKMDDALKDELKPTEPFIRYARGRLNEHANIAMPGQRAAYMAEFGHDRAKMKNGKPTGQTARRFRPNQQLIKVAPAVLNKGARKAPNITYKEPLRAAGIMLYTGTPDRPRILLLKRGPDGGQPGKWCFAGGKIEAGETPRQAAVREVSEEVGPVVHARPVTWTRRIADGVDFTTFAARVPDEFVPQLNEEHTAAKWVSVDNLPSPMHPGCAVSINKLRAAAGLPALAEASPFGALRRVGNRALGAIDRAAEPESLAHAGGQELGAAFARGAKAVVRHPLRTGRKIVAEGARFGAGVGQGVGSEFGLKGKGMQRATRIGAVAGGGKLAIGGALIAHKPIMRIARWATAPKQDDQQSKVQKMHLAEAADLAKRAPQIAAALWSSK
jgi:8-oxo-dGTP pyrophosphatase MutT (NUDIX family)